MRNPIQSFYQLSWIQKYENYLKSKRVVLSFLLIFTNLLAGIVYGYALGSIGAAFSSASAAFSSTNSTTITNTTSLPTTHLIPVTVEKKEAPRDTLRQRITFQKQNYASKKATTWTHRSISSTRPGISTSILNTPHDYHTHPIHDLHNEISPLMTTATTTSNTSNTTTSTTFDLGNSLLQGLFASSIFIGGFGGAMFIMLLGNYLGRKLCMILCCVIFSIGCIGACASNSYASLIVFRCIMGFGAAISTSVSSVYVAELMPFPKYQGVLGSMYNMGIASGLSAAYVIGAIFTGANVQSEQWRAVHAFGNLFSLLLLVVVVFCIPESPMFIGSGNSSNSTNAEGISVGGQENKNTMMIGPLNIISDSQQADLADPVLLKKEKERGFQAVTTSTSSAPVTSTTTTSTTVSNVHVATASDNQSKEGSEEQSKKMPLLAVLKRLFCSKIVISTILASYYCFAIEWTGIQSATLFTPSLLESAGVKEPLYQLLCSFAINVWQVLTIIPIIFLVDRFGRKTILLFGLTVSLLTDLAEGFIFQFATDGSTEKIVLALVFMAIYLIGFNIGLGSLTFILAHEVFNGEHERVIVLGTSMATMCLWIFSIILSLFFIPVVSVTNQAVPWFIFAGFSFIGLLLSIFLLKETSPLVLAKRKAKEDAKKELKTEEQKNHPTPPSTMNTALEVDVASDMYKNQDNGEPTTAVEMKEFEHVVQ
ncbi:hypothetical protein C9374_008623 [Naegleria lovaniensis]|uniref:Major facilitator superfamily (MFS) profile domain-containing protein n=1 Tax=Naegleria lovaniensis TaxID=51637 RepID=A0AA88GIT6_NAELO|nr:uncharacterized protein C9374_008623 [Naegleria lovaniensis]KAG2378001.1 hypothetical protein C9374_008623 [Naegleria lovaniensis]